jgi:hypothetical protein
MYTAQKQLGRTRKWISQVLPNKGRKTIILIFDMALPTTGSGGRALERSLVFWSISSENC